MTEPYRTAARCSLIQASRSVLLNDRDPYSGRYMPIRIVIVDDHPIVLHGLEQLFARHEDFTVVASCATGALAAVKAHSPDVLVLDLRVPEQDGLAVLRQMSDQWLTCRTVLLRTASSNPILKELYGSTKKYACEATAKSVAAAAGP